MLRLLGSMSSPAVPVWDSFLWKGLVFKNRLGIAGGVDKNAETLPAWWALGCGFIEVGTVTPLPQEPNPGSIIDRDLRTSSLWNKMGFPSAGAKEVLANLRAEAPYRTPVFVNIGKNRTTSNDDAIKDYESLIDTFAEDCDAYVVNISSPNTQGLRDLQNREALQTLLKPLVERASHYRKPLLVKLSPDMSEEAFAAAITAAADCGVDGFVLTNTTLDRTTDSKFPKEGGVSGAPLRQKSLKFLKLAQTTLGPRRKDFLLISVGGVLAPQDVFERIQAGADLVQVYSALIFSGPQFFKQVAEARA